MFCSHVCRAVVPQSFPLHYPRSALAKLSALYLSAGNTVRYGPVIFSGVDYVRPSNSACIARVTYVSAITLLCFWCRHCRGRGNVLLPQVGATLLTTCKSTTWANKSSSTKRFGRIGVNSSGRGAQSQPCSFFSSGGQQQHVAQSRGPCSLANGTKDYA